MSYFESIKFLLGKKFKLLAPMALLFLIASSVDLFGIALIGGYIGIIIDPSLVATMQKMFPVFASLNLSALNHEETILFFGYVLFFTFLVKFVLVILVNHRSIKICLF